MSPNKLGWISFLVLSCFVTNLHADSNASQIVKTIKTLQRISLQGESGPTIPRPVRPLLTSLKHQLIQEIIVILNSDIDLESNKQLNQRLLTSLRRKGIPISDEWDDSPYGIIYEPSVDRPKEHSDVLIVTTTLSVMCGEDTSVYLLKRKGWRWESILSVESNDYDDISDAPGALSYAISPPDAKGEYFLVVANITPWCSSFWQGLRYRAFRIPSEPNTPKMILSKEDIIYIGGESLFNLTVHQNYFDLEFYGNSADIGGSRKHIIRYKIEKDSATRIPPFAKNARDFLEEWAELPWLETSKLSVSVSSIQHWHSQLTKLSFWDYDADSKCANSDEWLITFDIGSYEKPERDSDVVYARIAQKGKSYFIQEISRHRPNCQ